MIKVGDVYELESGTVVVVLKYRYSHDSCHCMSLSSPNPAYAPGTDIMVFVEEIRAGNKIAVFCTAERWKYIVSKGCINETRRCQEAKPSAKIPVLDKGKTTDPFAAEGWSA